MVGTTLLCTDTIERASVGIRIKVLHLKSSLVVSAAGRARVSRKRSGQVARCTTQEQAETRYTENDVYCSLRRGLGSFFAAKIFILS